MTTNIEITMVEKIFKIKADEFIDLVPPMGSCIATDKITVEGMKVGYMYREEPNGDIDSAIIPYLGSPYGTELERIENSDEFQIITE